MHEKPVLPRGITLKPINWASQKCHAHKQKDHV